MSKDKPSRSSNHVLKVRRGLLEVLVGFAEMHGPHLVQEHIKEARVVLEEANRMTKNLADRLHDELIDAGAAGVSAGVSITNPRTLELDASRLKDLSLDYTRQGEALPEGRTQDVCHSVSLYLKLAGDALGMESQQLRKWNALLENDDLMVSMDT